MTRSWFGQRRNCGRIPGRGKKFFFSVCCLVWVLVPPSLLFGEYLRASSLWVKWLESEASISPSSGAEIKNEWSCTLIAVYAFMACMVTALPCTFYLNLQSLIHCLCKVSAYYIQLLWPSSSTHQFTRFNWRDGLNGITLIDKLMKQSPS